MEEVFKFLRKCGTYYLATDDEGQPRVRPFGTVNIYNGRLYIQTGKVKEVSRELKKNPSVEICAFDGQKWLRVSASAVEDDDRNARVSMLKAYPELKKLYDPDDGNTEVFFLKDAVCTFSSFTEPPRTINF